MTEPAERVSLIGIPTRICCVMAAAWGLGGCGSAPTVRTVTVEVPVPVPCIVEAVPQPVWAMDALPPSAGLYETARAALVEIEQRRAHLARVDAANQACK